MTLPYDERVKIEHERAEVARLMIRAWCGTPDGYVDPPSWAYPATKEAWERVAAVAMAWAASQSTVQGERDRYRAVLEGARYQHIDMLADLSVEECREIGEAVAEATVLLAIKASMQEGPEQ